MTEVRPAVPADAPELVRLRNVMLEEMPSMAALAGPGPWQATAERILRERLAVPSEELTMPSFVVDDPERPGRLAACAVGTLEERLPSPATRTACSASSSVSAPTPTTGCAVTRRPRRSRRPPPGRAAPPRP
ncbi:hypothetical protein [Kitasatospora aureofaciens]|uniref:hypothetical protein n=1 Tax=Kitasatospora aureofaciens TaxID=1894 RepID=UPI0033F4266B